MTSTAETTTQDTTAQEQQKDTYPLTICPISGEQLGEMGAPVVRMYDGREVRFCCTGCIDKFKADLQGSLKKMDQMIIAAQKPHYPLDVCLVSGEKLGEMGPPVDRVYDNQLVRFCCNSCIDKFEKNTDQYMKKLHAARAAHPAEKIGESIQKDDADHNHSEHQTHGEHEKNQ